jgi:hypothetical protein
MVTLPVMPGWMETFNLASRAMANNRSCTGVSWTTTLYSSGFSIGFGGLAAAARQQTLAPCPAPGAAGPDAGWMAEVRCWRRPPERTTARCRGNAPRRLSALDSGTKSPKWQRSRLRLLANACPGANYWLVVLKCLGQLLQRFSGLLLGCILPNVYGDRILCHCRFDHGRIWSRNRHALSIKAIYRTGAPLKAELASCRV